MNRQEKIQALKDVQAGRLNLQQSGLIDPFAGKHIAYVITSKEKGGSYYKVDGQRVDKSDEDAVRKRWHDGVMKSGLKVEIVNDDSL